MEDTAHTRYAKSHSISIIVLADSTQRKIVEEDVVDVSQTVASMVSGLTLDLHRKMCISE